MSKRTNESAVILLLSLTYHLEVDQAMKQTGVTPPLLLQAGCAKGTR